MRQYTEEEYKTLEDKCEYFRDKTRDFAEKYIMVKKEVDKLKKMEDDYKQLMVSIRKIQRQCTIPNHEVRGIQSNEQEKFFIKKHVETIAEIIYNEGFVDITRIDGDIDIKFILTFHTIRNFKI